MRSEETLDNFTSAMNSKKSRYPTYVFWGLIPILLIYSYLFLSPTGLDIQMHDTYFVIDLFHIRLFIVIYFGLIGFLYLKFEKFKLIKAMTFIHVLITFLVMILLPFNPMSASSLFSVDRLGYFDAYSTANFYCTMAILILVFAQLLFLVNLFIGFLRGRHEL